MPQPVSRLFPKISAKSDEAQLTLTANAFAVLATAHGSSQAPTRPASKDLSVISGRSIKFVLRVNHPSLSLPKLRAHLERALLLNATILDISPNVAIEEDRIIIVEPQTPYQASIPSLYAVMDHISLDFRLSQSPSIPESEAASQSSDSLLLPIRQLVDETFNRLIAHLVRLLPHAFGTWKNTLHHEMINARHAARHVDHMLNLARDDRQFHRSVKRQLERLDHCLRSERDKISDAFGIGALLETEVDASATASEPTPIILRDLIPFATEMSFQKNIRPRLRTVRATEYAPLELIDDSSDNLVVPNQSSDAFCPESLNPFDEADEDSLLIDSPVSCAPSMRCHDHPTSEEISSSPHSVSSVLGGMGISRAGSPSILDWESFGGNISQEKHSPCVTTDEFSMLLETRLEEFQQDETPGVETAETETDWLEGL